MSILYLYLYLILTKLELMQVYAYKNIKFI